MDIRKFIDKVRNFGTLNEGYAQIGANSLMEGIKLNNTNKSSNLNESSLNRVYSFIINYDCAIITAFRSKLVNCVDNTEFEKLNIYDNKGRNKSLKAVLLSLGYGVTKVKGSYIENYLSDNQIEVKEDSFFVVNLSGDPSFIDKIKKLGEMFCQDSVMILEKGGENNYLFGTNNSDFPGYGEISSIGNFKPGVEAEFMTKVDGRPFTLESFGDLQINSKRLVKEFAKPILGLL